MKNNLVIHKNPDVDAILSLYIVIRFVIPQTETVEIKFVPAGHRWKGDGVVWHLDVGGKFSPSDRDFDHHTEGMSEKCATSLVAEHFKLYNNKRNPFVVDAVQMASHCDLGHKLPDKNPNASGFYSLPVILKGFREMGKTDLEVVLSVFQILDSVRATYGQSDRLKMEVRKGNFGKVGNLNFVTYETEGPRKASRFEAFQMVKLVFFHLSNSSENWENGICFSREAQKEYADLISGLLRIVAEDNLEEYFLHPEGAILYFNGSKELLEQIRDKVLDLIRERMEG